MFMNNIYIGKVLRTDDPLKIGRLKISIFGKYDELDEEFIPWAFPLNNLNAGFVNIPKVGEFLNCYFENNDENVPFYTTNINLNELTKNTISSDYPKVWSLISDNRLGDNGNGEEETKRTLQIYYTETQGFIINKNETIINIKNSDESVVIKNGKTGKVVHLSENGISLGTEEKSKESAVLGETLENLLNSFISELGKISGIATPTGPSGPLSSSPQWTLLVNKFKSDWVDFKSTIVSLD